jgi:hypothetical protein
MTNTRYTTTLAMSRELLDVLTALHNKKMLGFPECFIGLIDMSGIRTTTRDYYYNLPKKHTTELGLKLDEDCFYALHRIHIPDIWQEADEDELSKYSISFHSY